MMYLNYAMKADLKAAIGQDLKYTETSIFGEEFKADGTFAGSNRPHTNPECPRMPNGGKAREFFASVTMQGGKIARVE